MRPKTKNPKCRRCGVKLTVSNCKPYHLNKSDYICNGCYKIVANKASKDWAKNNKDKVNASARRYKLKNPDKVKGWYRAKVYRKYGLTVEDFDAQYNKQRGCCAMCGKHSLELSRALDIDHNHITNKNRGLLCSTCNLAIGLLKVDEEGINLLQKAIDYIRKYDKV